MSLSLSGFKCHHHSDSSTLFTVLTCIVVYCYAMCKVKISLDSSDEMWPRVLTHDVIIPYTL